MKHPLISILTPFKNTEAYLSECITSIINQTYQDWELLIIDDNSTDSSHNIVSGFAKNDSRIRLFKNNGNGIIDALKLAFNESKGDYITRMDSDDVMHKEKLDIMLKSLLKHGKKHLAVGQVNYFSNEGISNGYDRYEKWLNNLTKTGTNYSEIYKECVIPSPCWMLNREDLIACDAFNPNRYPEDYDLTFRFYEYGYKCIPCDTVLHYWRDYSTRTSRTHEHYAQNYFLHIKYHYFIKLDYDTTRPLTVWGAGFKGKTIAKLLKENNIPFTWICDNPKKIGKHIYDVELQNFNALETIKNPQSIITVANEGEQHIIKNYLNNLGKKPMVDYFFFC